MSIFKPVDGFKLIIRPAAQSLLDSAEADPRFRRQWENAVKTLRQTAHRIGVVRNKPVKNARIIAFGGENAANPYEIVVICRALGDTLTIYMLSITDTRA